MGPDIPPAIQLAAISVLDQSAGVSGSDESLIRGADFGGHRLWDGVPEPGVPGDPFGVSDDRVDDELGCRSCRCSRPAAWGGTRWYFSWIGEHLSSPVRFLVHTDGRVGVSDGGP
jgi:hypothetical protein